MPTYKAPVDDALFLLNDVFHLERNLPGFGDASPDVMEAVLREVAKFSEEVLTPLNRVGDREGCTRHADASVTTPTGFKDAFKQLVIDGNVITGGGVTAGIDFGLRVIAEVAGETTARRIQLGIEYDPAPPFDSGHPDKAPTIKSELLSARYDELMLASGAMRPTSWRR
jgi:Acyl-CoA dehydrogenase N terminal